MLPHHGQQHILDAAVAELVHDAETELRALVLPEPETEDLLGAVGAHPECDMHRLVANEALVLGLHPQCVEEDQGIHRLQWPRLPGRNLVQHGVSNRADQSGETSRP
jgi:hypothetical protein